MYYVYLLKSKAYPDKTYVGFTDDIKNRLSVHNMGGSRHTAQYKPWKLHVVICFDIKGQALEFEKYIKSHSGRAFASKHLW